LAFGVKRAELEAWKTEVLRGNIAFLTHYWYDPRFPDITTVTKVGCADLERLIRWCAERELNPRYIHRTPPFPHFDLIGQKQKEVLREEGLHEHLVRFRIR